MFLLVGFECIPWPKVRPSVETDEALQTVRYSRINNNCVPDEIINLKKALEKEWEINSFLNNSRELWRKECVRPKDKLEIALDQERKTFPAGLSSRAPSFLKNDTSSLNERSKVRHQEYYGIKQEILQGALPFGLTVKTFLFLKVSARFAHIYVSGECPESRKRFKSLRQIL